MILQSFQMQIVHFFYIITIIILETTVKKETTSHVTKRFIFRNIIIILLSHPSLYHSILRWIYVLPWQLKNTFHLLSCKPFCNFNLFLRNLIWKNMTMQWIKMQIDIPSETNVHNLTDRIQTIYKENICIFRINQFLMKVIRLTGKKQLVRTIIYILCFCIPKVHLH